MNRVGISDWFRERRAEALRQVIRELPRQGQSLRVIDLGGTRRFWQSFGVDFLREQAVHITLINQSGQEITNAGEVTDLFSESVGDACQLNFDDHSFDLCHSNSVIEHVGDWPRMGAFAAEVRRIAPAHYVQTPNRSFPIDPHFPGMPYFHRMPRALKASLLMTLPLAHAGRAKSKEQAYRMADSSALLSRAQMLTLFPDSELRTEQFGPLAKSLIAFRRSALDAPQTLEKTHG